MITEKEKTSIKKLAMIHSKNPTLVENVIGTQLIKFGIVCAIAGGLIAAILIAVISMILMW